MFGLVDKTNGISIAELNRGKQTTFAKVILQMGANKSAPQALILLCKLQFIIIIYFLRNLLFFQWMDT